MTASLHKRSLQDIRPINPKLYPKTMKMEFLRVFKNQGRLTAGSFSEEFSQSPKKQTLRLPKSKKKKHGNPLSTGKEEGLLSSEGKKGSNRDTPIKELTQSSKMVPKNIHTSGKRQLLPIGVEEGEPEGSETL